MKRLFSARINFDLMSNTFKKQKNLLIIFSILLSITFPFAIIVRIISNTPIYFDSTGTEFLPLLFIATVFLLLATPLIFFNYLTSKRSVDFMHALPIKRKDLFITQMITSLLFIVIPFTISYWGGYILLYLFQGLSVELAHFTLFVKAILLFAVIQAPTHFVIMNTGTTSDSIIYSIIMFLAPYIAYGAFEIFASTFIVGVESLSSSNLLMFISPSAALFKLLIFNNSNISPILVILYWLVANMIFTAVTIHLYERWRSERSELPFNNRYFFSLVSSTFIAFLLVFTLSVFSFDRQSPWKFLAIQNLLIPVLFTFVVYVILDTIRKRSFQRLTKSLKRYSIIAISTLLLTTIIYVTQGFGYSNFIPDVDDIDSIMVTSNLGYDDPLFSETINEKYIISEITEIKKVIDVHHAYVRIFKETNRLIKPLYYESPYLSNDSVYESGNLTFQYRLKNGKKVTRSYRLPVNTYDIAYQLLDLNSIRLKSQPLFDATKPTLDVKLYSGVMDKEYSVDFDLILTTLKEEYLRVESLSTQATLRYVILYTHKDHIYQINIDDRFPATIGFIERYTKGETPTNFNHYIVNQDEYNFNHGVTYPASFHNYIENLEDKKTLTPSELNDARARIFSIDLNTKNSDTLVINTSTDYDPNLILIPLR